MPENWTEHVSPDRRQSARRPSPVNRLIRAELIPEGQDPFGVYLYLVDLSEGGVRINADYPLPADMRVDLSFSLKGFPLPKLPVSKLHVTVERAWDKVLLGGTWTSGLRFVDLPESSLTLVQSLLMSLTPEGKRQRFRLRDPIGVALQSQEQDWWATGVPMDLSVDGLRVRAYFKVVPQKEVKVIVLLPNQPELILRAEIRATREVGPERHELDLVFLEPPAAAIQAIQTYIDRACGVIEP